MNESQDGTKVNEYTVVDLVSKVVCSVLSFVFFLQQLIIPIVFLTYSSMPSMQGCSLLLPRVALEYAIVADEHAGQAKISSNASHRRRNCTIFIFRSSIHPSNRPKPKSPAACNIIRMPAGVISQNTISATTNYLKVTKVRESLKRRDETHTHNTLWPINIIISIHRQPICRELWTNPLLKEP